MRLDTCSHASLHMFVSDVGAAAISQSRRCGGAGDVGAAAISQSRRCHSDVGAPAMWARRRFHTADVAAPATPARRRRSVCRRRPADLSERLTYPSGTHLRGQRHSGDSELQLSVIIVLEVLMLPRELLLLMSTQTTPSLEPAERRGLQMWLLS